MTPDPATPSAHSNGTGDGRPTGFVVTRRLKRRPPLGIRRVRAVLYLIALINTPWVLIGLLLLVNGRTIPVLAPTTQALVAFVGFTALLVFLCVFLARSIREWLAAQAAIALGLFFVVLGIANVTAVLLGAVTDPNLAAALFLNALLYVPLGAAIVIGLVRNRRWFGEEAERLRTTRPMAQALRTYEPAQAVPHDGDGREAAIPLVVVEGLKKHFPIYGGLLRRQIGTVYAVDGVDFEIARGETFALVGESGCGKTTLGRTLLQLTPPTDGRVYFEGYELADVESDEMRPLRRRMQIIFQDPFGSLNPRMPISDIIGEGLLAQGVRNRRERDQRVERSLEAVGLRRSYTRRYPHEFSGGQRQRIGIARALALQPDFIVCDEPVSALDVSIQSQILNLLRDLREQFDLTYLFITHNLSVVQYFADRVAVMYLGRIAELATVEQLYAEPRHPYSVALLSAVPQADPRRRRKRLVLKGDLPSPAAPPSGCTFHTRCWLREQLGNPENCVTEVPPLRDVGNGQLAACHWAEKISGQRVETAAEQTSVLETAVAAGEE